LLVEMNRLFGEIRTISSKIVERRAVVNGAGPSTNIERGDMMSGKKAGPEPDLGDVALTDALRALADPVRMEIVRMAARQPDQPCHAFFESIPKSTMSHHWNVLREAGLIHQERRGTQKLNSLRRAEFDERFPGLLDAVLRVAD
jgi:DNA-binding transcriptional ArsR family regulator